jgi:small subunit ribosomal protein S9
MEDYNEDQSEEVAEVLTLEEEVPEEPQIDPTGQVVGLDDGKYHWGTGRRKCSIARVRIRPGKGEFALNGRSLEDFFPRVMDRAAVLSPLRDLGVDSKLDVLAQIEGGGQTGQAGAVRLGIARALLIMYPDSLGALRAGNHLTRDPRMVERKKYGLRGARRAFQWVKR